MSGVELFLGGIAALAVLSVVVKARAGVKKARADAEIARVGASPVSLVGHLLITAGLIVGAQWLVITYAASDTTLLLVVLAVPALFAAYPVTKALTVMQVRPTRSRGGRR
jgi:predicted transporter